MTSQVGAGSLAALRGELDEPQAFAVHQISAGVGNFVVVGEPGAGKTTVVIAAAAQAVDDGLDPAQLMVLAPSRVAAAALRDRVSLALNRPVGGPVVRTPASLAFALLASGAAARGEPPPALISGPEQDQILRELLEGHANGRVAPLDWGGALPQDATLLPGFRAELRDLLMRAAEWGIDHIALDALGQRTGRPEWVAAAHFMQEYDDVTSLGAVASGRGARFDPAHVVSLAAQELKLNGWPGQRWQLVIVDDAQDMTAAVHDLLAALADLGARIVLVGNADQTVQGYRGAVPAALAAATNDRGPYSLSAKLLELGPTRRQSGVLERVSLEITNRIGRAGAGAPRRPSPEVTQGSAARVKVLTAPHRYGQSRAIAGVLRRARHGLDGEEIPWNRMAVIARSAAQLQEIRTDLAAADIPCSASGESVPLAQEPAVAPLMQILRAAAGEPWTEETALAVLGSRLVGIDPVMLRKLRRELLRVERERGGAESSSNLLVAAMEQPETWRQIGGAQALAAARVAKAVLAARERMAQSAPTPGAVVWAAWSALEVAEHWRSAALAGSARDHADLDAVIAVLRQAQNYAEKLPGSQVSEFVSYLQGQSFAADSLGATGDQGDVVALVTAASAAGQEWDLVVIAGVEEGIWPNLRLRDSVLSAQLLADIAAGRAEPTPLTPQGRIEQAAVSRRQVLDDETRSMLVAVSRATKQLVVTAQTGDDARPSRYLSLIADAANVPIEDAGRTDVLQRVADVRSAVAAIRAMAERAQANPAASAQAEQLLHVLAWLRDQQVPGADPSHWHGAPTISTTEAFWQEDQPVRVSPSKVEWVERCTLRWALESAGGRKDASDAQQVGTLIHEIAARHPRGGSAQIMEDFEREWRERYEADTWAGKVAYAKAKAAVQRLAIYLDSRKNRPVVAEASFAVALGRAQLVGSIDRVETTEDGIYVVDIKTGAPISAEEAKTNAQLEMYQLAVAMGAFGEGTQASGAELAFMSQGAKAAIRPQGPVEAEAAAQRLEDAVELMAGHQFAATINDGCRGCPVRRSCPAQSQGRQVTDQ